ncbi:MAG: hypothetical protein DDT26_00879 [Dehalococcoidia bacterium]|nr:hypothetical protein [Chloroflexota bacterium]
MGAKRLLFFDSMVTPKVITFVYWILLAAIALGGLLGVVAAFGMMSYQTTAGIGTLILVPIGVVASALIARMYCEIMIVLFKMHECLSDIRGSKPSN